MPEDGLREVNVATAAQVIATADFFMRGEAVSRDAVAS
jgi:hypothetical protein